MIVCPKCGRENAEGTMNCAGCRINLEWAVEDARGIEEQAAPETVGIQREVMETRGELSGCALVVGLAIGMVGLWPLWQSAQISSTASGKVPAMFTGLVVVGIGLILFLVGLVGSIRYWVSRRRE